MSSRRVPTLAPEVRQAAKSAVVLLREVIHVVALGSLADVSSVKVVLSSQLHPVAVIGEGVAQEPAFFWLDGFDEGTGLRGDDRRSAQLSFHVNFTEGLQIHGGVKRHVS